MNSPKTQAQIDFGNGHKINTTPFANDLSAAHDYLFEFNDLLNTELELIRGDGTANGFAVVNNDDGTYSAAIVTPDDTSFIDLANIIYDWTQETAEKSGYTIAGSYRKVVCAIMYRRKLDEMNKNLGEMA